MNICILSKKNLLVHPIHNWIPRESNYFHLITVPNQQGDLKFYQTKTFLKNYDTNEALFSYVINLHKKFPLDRIISLSECDVLRAARLRKYLNIPGQKTESAIVYRDKLLMKKKIAEAGINVAKFSALRNPIDLLKFKEKNGFPFVIKPRFGTGSEGVKIIYNDSMLYEFLENHFSNCTDQNAFMMMENFIEGKMYHVDGYIIDGKPVETRVSEYVNSCLGVSEGKSLGSIMLDIDSEIGKRLSKITNSIVEYFPKIDFGCSFHAEFFVTDSKDTFFFNEIACRTGGARISKAFELCTGINLNRASVLAQTGLYDLLKKKKPPKRKSVGWMIYPPVKGTLLDIPHSIPFAYILDYSSTKKIGIRHESAKLANQNIAGYTVFGDNYNHVKERLCEADKWMKSRVIWDINNPSF